MDLNKLLPIDSETVEALRVTGVGTAGVTYSFLGLPLNEIVTILTGVYVLCQIILLSPKMFRFFRSIGRKVEE